MPYCHARSPQLVSQTSARIRFLSGQFRNEHADQTFVIKVDFRSRIITEGRFLMSKVARIRRATKVGWHQAWNLRSPPEPRRKLVYTRFNTFLKFGSHLFFEFCIRQRAE